MINFKNGEIDQWGPIDGVILYPSIFFKFFSKDFFDRWGVRWSRIWGFFRDDKMVFYWFKKDLEREGKKAIQKWLLDGRNFRELKRLYKQSVKNLNSISEELDSRPRSQSRASLSGNERQEGSKHSEVKGLALKWHEEYLNFWSISSVSEVANYGAPEYLKNLLRNIVPKEKMGEVLEGFLAPEYLSFHQRSILELLETRNLQEYAKKWYWVENSYYKSKILTSRDFKKNLDDFKQKNIKKLIREIANYPERIVQRKLRFAKRYKISGKILDVAQRLSYSIWWQDNRKGIAWWADSVIDKFNRFAPRDILYYSEKEWRDFFALSKKLPRSEIIARKKFCVIDFKPEGYSVITGKRGRRLAAKYEQAVTTGGKEIKGLVVSKSKKPIRGRVRVLKSTRNMDVFQKGEILVAPMTSPDYIGAMRKAKAIITDVGGLMSHAAVVSRELGVPCIVGTKIATKVLRDGDVVEVDAERGIVRVIKRSKA